MTMNTFVKISMIYKISVKNTSQIFCMLNLTQHKISHLYNVK